MALPPPPVPCVRTCTAARPDVWQRGAGQSSASPTYHFQPQMIDETSSSWTTSKNDPPKPTVPKVAETKQPIQVLHAVRTGVSAEAGRGRATVPPPKPQPQCTRRERRTRAKGSGVFAVGPPVPLTRGLRSSRGRQRSPLPLIPRRRHSSRPGEAQSEEAACCGWAVTSLAPCLPCWPLPPRLGLLGVESPGDPACTGRSPPKVAETGQPI